ncbi:MAG: type VI secretion system baseplate subunit TssK [Limnobacter sp.]|nr:type VI secretion system baseplate subunit TssK [Limnobacter sp.]
MSSIPHKKVAWLEGQFLYPQHFQQQERYLEHRLEQRSAAIRPFVEGFSTCLLDTSLLAKGKVALQETKGIMPDGTPFDLPKQAALPAAIDIGLEVKQQLVYLVLPLYRPGSQAITRDLTKTTVRYHCQDTEVFDDHNTQTTQTLASAEPAFSLRLATDALGGWDRLPIARIKEVSAAGAVLLDEDYIPPMLHMSSHEQLVHYHNNLLSVLEVHSETLAARLKAMQSAGAALSGAAIRDEQLLRLLSGALTRFRHWREIQGTHPETFYEHLAVLLAEITAFTPARRLGRIAPYQHHAIDASLSPLVDACQFALKQLLEEVAENIELKFSRKWIPISQKALNLPCWPMENLCWRYIVVAFLNKSFSKRFFTTIELLNAMCCQVWI